MPHIQKISRTLDNWEKDIYIESNRTDKSVVFYITVESPSDRHRIQFIALNDTKLLLQP